MIFHHLTLTTIQRLPLAPDEAARRAMVRLLARTVGPALTLFCIVDDHAHVVVQAERPAAGRLAQALGTALAPVVTAPLAPTHIQPVDGRKHLRTLASYMLAQPARHGLSAHPALYSGSCFQDLLGARVAAPLAVHTALPRLRMRDLLPEVGLPGSPIPPAPSHAIRQAGASRVAAAAAAALAAGPDLRGRRAQQVAAKTAAAHLCDAAGIHPQELAWALGLSPRSARRLAAASAPPAHIAAAATRLALEDAVGRALGVTPA